MSTTREVGIVHLPVLDVPPPGLVNLTRGSIRSTSATAANHLAAQVEMVRTRIRYTEHAISMDLAVALFGGSSPFTATALIAATGNSLARASCSWAPH